MSTAPNQTYNEYLEVYEFEEQNDKKLALMGIDNCNIIYHI